MLMGRALKAFHFVNLHIPHIFANENAWVLSTSRRRIRSIEINCFLIEQPLIAWTPPADPEFNLETRKLNEQERNQPRPSSRIFF